MVRFAEFGYFRVLESNRRSLKVFIREIPLGTDTERSAPFSISIANQTTVTSESFKYVNRDWSFISDLPGGQNHNPPGFTIQNTLYLNTGQPGEWWSYNIQSRNWRLQSRTPAGDGNFLTKEALTIGNEGFIIQRKENSNDSLFFWRFRPSTDQWTRTTALSIPAEAKELDSYAAFAIEQHIFICFSGLENNCWTYDLSSNQWTSFRSFSNFFSTNNFYKIVPLAGASVGQKGYIVAQQGNTRYLLEYDPAVNIWRKVSGYPENLFPNNASSFSFQGKVFFLSLIPVYNEAFEWNPSAQTSRRWPLPTPPANISVSGGQALPLTDRIYFAIGGKLYQWFPR